ncbi:hypothetical protein [Archangium minus]|uniref:hypothetical protein n=1 Tax=Archangium minus TaxID=83450 RepID=UPI0037BE6E2B
MGVVYAARDPMLGRTVALKLLWPGMGGEKERARLVREAQAMARLAHPHMGREVDARGDQFSFCVTLHEALYGVRPFDARARGQESGDYAAAGPAPLYQSMIFFT